MIRVNCPKYYENYSSPNLITTWRIDPSFYSFCSLAQDPIRISNSVFHVCTPSLLCTLYKNYLFKISVFLVFKYLLYLYAYSTLI